ncbi:MAG: YybH family protein [Janthinobacterium lividum]
MHSVRRVAAAAALAVSIATNALPVCAAEPAGAPSFSSDPQVAAQQHQVYDVVHRYETLLNAGDTAGIMAMFAPGSVAEWNNRATFATPEERKAAYDALFKDAKFSTVFGYASVEAWGDTGMVRTFHHNGAAVLEGGKEVVDLNREVFVLRRIGGEWKIVLYIFNTDPVQGEG